MNGSFLQFISSRSTKRTVAKEGQFARLEAKVTEVLETLG